MSTTLAKEIRGVRSILGGPLSQFPSTKDILNELEAEYQQITNRLNNTGNAWLIEDYHLITADNQARYRLDVDLDNFYKPLSVLTIPQGVGISYDAISNKTGVNLNPATASSFPEENWLEFVELEHIPKAWSSIRGMGGSVFGNAHSSEYVAFYRKIDNTGEKQYCEIRPVPNGAQNYRILYQVTDWWDRLFSEANTLNQKLPASSQRNYVRALVAKNLIASGLVKWSYSIQYNLERAKLALQGIDDRINRYGEDFKEYITSLDNPDITYIDNWADDVGL